MQCWLVGKHMPETVFLGLQLVIEKHMPGYARRDSAPTASSGKARYQSSQCGLHSRSVAAVLAAREQKRKSRSMLKVTRVHTSSQEHERKSRSMPKVKGVHTSSKAYFQLSAPGVRGDEASSHCMRPVCLSVARSPPGRPPRLPATRSGLCMHTPAQVPRHHTNKHCEVGVTQQALRGWRHTTSTVRLASNNKHCEEHSTWQD